jgi:protein-disulfide isomerase
MRSPIHLLIAVLLATLASAQQKPAAPSLPSEATVNAFLQQTLGWNPSLNWKVQDIRPSSAEGLAEITVVISGPQGSSASKFYVTPDGQHAVLGSVIPFGAHPFDATRKQLEKGINGPSRGPADAHVMLVEFSDLQCPHCKAAQPTVDKLLSEEKNTRLVFQSFPLANHDWALKAASYADCVARSSGDAFWKFLQATYDAQTDITVANADEKLSAIAGAAGVKSADIASCAAQPETAERVQHSVALGKAVDVTGTPMLFINGRAVANLGGISYEELKSLVEFAAKDSAAPAAAAK